MPVAFAATATIQALRYPSDAIFSTAAAVSANGQAVAGGGPSQGFRWTLAGGYESIEGPNIYNPAAISADGSTIVGEFGGPPVGPVTAFRWTSAGGVESLGSPVPGGYSFGTAVSGDGSVVAATTGIGPVRWTSATGWQTLATGVFGGSANAISPDGQIIVGSLATANGFEAFRWTQSGGMLVLGDLPGGDVNATATALTPDGSIIVGTATTAVGREAFIWTAQDGMHNLGHLPGGSRTLSIVGISADGQFVVGNEETGELPNGIRSHPVLWDQEHGIRKFVDVLQHDHGLDLTGWTLIQATGFSADGTTIVGSGNEDPRFSNGGWRVVIPEPSAIAVIFISTAIISSRRLQRRP